MLMQVAKEDVEVQRKGIVYMMWSHNLSLGQMKRRRDVHQKLFPALPVRFSTTHIILPDIATSAVVASSSQHPKTKTMTNPFLFTWNPKHGKHKHSSLSRSSSTSSSTSTSSSFSDDNKALIGRMIKSLFVYTASPYIRSRLRIHTGKYCGIR